MLAIRFSTERNTHTETSRGRKLEGEKKDTAKTQTKTQIQRKDPESLQTTKQKQQQQQQYTEISNLEKKNEEEKLLHSPNAFFVKERMREATSKQFSRNCAILNHLDFLKLLHCTSPSLLLLFSSFSSSSASSAYLLSLASSFSPVRRIAKLRSTSAPTQRSIAGAPQAPLSVLPLNV